MQHLTVFLFLFTCFCLLMNFTLSSRLAIGASNRTYFICKVLIGFCHYSIIAHLRTFFHYSLSQYPLYFDCLKGNNSLSCDKKLFLFQHYLFPLWMETFCFEQERFISWKETLLPWREVISIAIKPILLYQKCILLYRKLSLLDAKCFLLHTKTFLVHTNPILLTVKSFLLPTK